MHRYKDLKLWVKSRNLCLEIYNQTKLFPKEENYCLTQQIRRCAISIPSNIAEGAGRNSDKEFINFLSISNGSTFELNTQLDIANKLKYINDNDYKKIEAMIVEIQNMNFSLQKKLKNSM